VIAFQLILQIGVAIVFGVVFASSPHNFDILENFQNSVTVPLRQDSYKTIAVMKLGEHFSFISRKKETFC
jgi:hypothetical protein